MIRAFSMIELIFVIVVVSILSILAVPKFDKKIYQYYEGNTPIGPLVNPNIIQARNQLLSHLRYTKSLALIDNKFLPNPSFGSNLEVSEWFRSLWQIKFTSLSYEVFSDKPPFNRVADSGEYAKDPLTKKDLNPTDSHILNLDEKFGVTSISLMNLDADANRTFTSISSIFFDNMGRPYIDINKTTNQYQFLLSGKVQIKLSDSTNPSEYVGICIEAETGYAYSCYN